MIRCKLNIFNQQCFFRIVAMLLLLHHRYSISIFLDSPHIKVPLEFTHPIQYAVPSSLYQCTVLNQSLGNKTYVAGGTCGRHAIKNAIFCFLLLDRYKKLSMHPKNAQLLNELHAYVRNITHLTPANQELLRLIDTQINSLRDSIVRQNPTLSWLAQVKDLHPGGTFDSIITTKQPLFSTSTPDVLIEYQETQNILDSMHALSASYNAHATTQGQPLAGITSSNIGRVNAIEIENTGMLLPDLRLCVQSQEERLHNWKKRTLNAACIQEIIKFRLNNNYLHAFILFVNTQSPTGYGEPDHAITVVVEKRDGKPYFIVMDSGDHPQTITMRCIHDFIRLINDSTYAPLPEEAYIQSLLKNPMHGLPIIGKPGQWGYQELIDMYTHAISTGKTKYADALRAYIEANKKIDLNKPKGYIRIYLKHRGF